MIIKRVGGLDICLEIDRSNGRGGQRSVGDGKGDFECLVDLDLCGAVVSDFTCCVYYVCPFPAVCRVRCEAGGYNGCLWDLVDSCWERWGGKTDVDVDVDVGRR